MPKITRPKLVNRGAAGLLVKLDSKAKEALAIDFSKYPIDNIASDLLHLAVPIEQLIFDPQNARLHPERNIRSIKLSLCMYSQRTPLVVVRSTNHVIKGNGTMQSAKELGWTKLAAIFVDDDPATAAGYGLADNRTAELASWDFEVVAMLEKLVTEAKGETVEGSAGQEMIGWSADEIQVLRMTDWNPPPEANSQKNESVTKSLLMAFKQDQYKIVEKAITAICSKLNNPKLDRSKAVMLICQAYLESLADGPEPD